MDKTAVILQEILPPSFYFMSWTDSAGSSLLFILLDNKHLNISVNKTLIKPQKLNQIYIYLSRNNVLKLYFLTLCVSAVSYSRTRWLICEVAFCLRTVPRLCESRHTSIVCAAEQAAYRSVGSRVSLWLPAPEREEGVWPGHVQACAGSCGSSEEGNWETWAAPLSHTYTDSR